MSGVGAIFGTIGKGMGAGIGGPEVEAPPAVKPSTVTPGIAERIRESLPSIPALPGAGDLWTYDSKGLAVTGKGWLVAGAVAVGAYLLMGRS